MTVPRTHGSVDRSLVRATRRAVSSSQPGGANGNGSGEAGPPVTREPDRGSIRVFPFARGAALSRADAPTGRRVMRGGTAAVHRRSRTPVPDRANGGSATMITIACPWCEVEQAAQVIGQDHDAAPFSCHECGTT